MEKDKSNFATVSDFRSYLEVSYQTKYDAYSFFSNINSENDSVLKEIGYNRFLLNDNFDYTWNSTNLDEPTKNDIISYCTQRLDETQSHQLLARYNNALLVILKNNRYAYKAIDSYKIVADFYLKESNKETKNAFVFLNTTAKLLQLYKLYMKDKVGDLATYFHNIINQSHPLDIKIGLLRIFSEEKIFKLKDIQHLSSLCLDIYNKVNEKNKKERILEIGLKLSQRTKNNSEIVKFAELLGDLTLQDIYEYDDKNIAISHMNELTYEKAIKYYKLAKTNEKISATTVKLENNRTHHKYLKFPIYLKSQNKGAIIDGINKLVKEEIGKGLIEILFPICRYNHSSLLIDYDKLKTSIENNKKDYFYTSCFKAVRTDKWGNKHHTTHEAIAIHNSFQLMYQRSTLLYIPLLFCNLMRIKKINIKQFRSALKKAGFFTSISIMRSGEYVKIPLYDIVGKGLEDYIKQNNKLFSEK